ncbi:MAG: M23 family metallopeptidase [Acidobacteriota bacterium]
MIEIQIHPSDIRRKVRYFFFDRRRVMIGIGLGSLLLLFVVASMAVAPSVIRRVHTNNYLYGMRQERAAERERLKRNVEQIRILQQALDAHRLEVAKLTTAYGLQGPVLGHGGVMTGEYSNRATSTQQIAQAVAEERQLTVAMQRLQQQVDSLSTYEAANAQLIRHIPSILPVPEDLFVLTSPFGIRISPFTKASDFHKGLDLAAPVGTQVVASADGVVTFAGRFPLPQSVAWWRFGNVVVINHGDRFITIYGHCDTVRVTAGQTVNQGQPIATVGSTGWSTNSHLHYEIRTDLQHPGIFEPVDPRIYILNYQWTDEETLLIRARSSKKYENFDPLPSAFIGRRRGV